jgi:tetratricopeptide (TPR) repeat protein
MDAASMILAAALFGAPSPSPSVDDELARARAFLEAGEAPRAVEVVRGVLPRRDTPDVRHLLGDALEASGDLLGAAEEFQKAAHGDASEENLFDWGNCLLQLRAYVPATDVLAEAVRRFPRSARLQVGLGIVRYARGQFEDAIRAFGAAADLEPDDERPYLFLGEMYGVSASLAPEVTKRLARFVEARPGHALGHFFYAMSLWKGTPGAAPSPEVLVHLKKAVALDPRLAKAHFQLGVLYGDEGRYPEAIAALEEAVRLEPSMAQAHYRLAQAYRRTGQEERAAKALEEFGRLQPQ